MITVRAFPRRPLDFVASPDLPWLCKLHLYSPAFPTIEPHYPLPHADGRTLSLFRDFLGSAFCWRHAKHPVGPSHFSVSDFCICIRSYSLLELSPYRNKPWRFCLPTTHQSRDPRVALATDYRSNPTKSRSAHVARISPCTCFTVLLPVLGILARCGELATAAIDCLVVVARMRKAQPRGQRGNHGPLENLFCFRTYTSTLSFSHSTSHPNPVTPCGLRYTQMSVMTMESRSYRASIDHDFLQKNVVVLWYAPLSGLPLGYIYLVLLL
ncbi:hypothetical protein BJ546DRAFT_369529 [Cryomyces antarcticus]